ncbi:MAG: tRNA (adenosine(37)-N6)-threonylcarbamoyltransferase complex dimerization subunit type 1 TsaB [Chitinivibrionales bacterium]
MKNWILGIDTSSIELGIGLLLDNAPVASFSRYLRNSHAEHITEGIHFILNNNKISPADIPAAAVTVGPGSFTGLRIGISFIKGLFLSRPIDIYPISSLEAVAMGWYARSATITVALDARNNRVFAARFSKKNNLLQRISEDTLMEAEDFHSLIEQKDVVLTDTLGYARSSVFAFLRDHDRHFALEAYPIQRGMAAARCALQAQQREAAPVDLQQLLPRYLQQSAAELRRAPQTKNQV